MAEVHTNESQQAGLRWDWKWLFQWSFVFTLNLIIPLLFCQSILRDGGWYGVAGGIIALWFMGICCGYLPDQFRKSIFIGGSLSAASQFIPVLQIFCGGLAIRSWEGITGLSVEPPDSMIEVSTFGVTVLMGQFMIATTSGTIFVAASVYRQMYRL
jgi:hypothetical protein